MSNNHEYSKPTSSNLELKHPQNKHKLWFNIIERSISTVLFLGTLGIDKKLPKPKFVHRNYIIMRNFSHLLISNFITCQGFHRFTTLVTLRAMKIFHSAYWQPSAWTTSPIFSGEQSSTKKKLLVWSA